MSSFEHPHSIFLFELKNGKKKLSYGESPEDALDVLRIRLSAEEMNEILPERCTKIRQRDLARYIGELG